MKTITVKASNVYDVDVGHGLLSQAGHLIATHVEPGGMPPSERTVAVVSDSRVDSLYGSQVREALREAGYQVKRFVFPQGEGSKNMSVLTELLEYLAREGVTRTDLIAALGGGVTGDLAGFAASVYLRGIPYVQIPTTLLAAVDSSVGGKTAVNLTCGKNLAGSFYQPDYVLCDCDAFETLEPETFADGVSESLKYGLAFDAPLFHTIAEEGGKRNWEEIVARCVQLKAQVVSQDEFDQGARQILNLGHTIGHAIEKVSGFTVSHGKAVAAGMAMIARAAERKGLCEAGTAGRIQEALIACNLPAGTDYSADSLGEAALSDKKRRGDRITLVIPLRIGESRLHTIQAGELGSWLSG